ncbi:MAG: hypothetical protein Tsb009_26480 [Planctomycetaceae bacterium]
MQKEAKRLNRPVIVHFYADWCGPCRRMERETLKSQALSRQAADHFLALKVNTDRQPGLTQRYNVRVLPTDIILGPNGRVLARMEGYQSPKQYLARVARVDASFSASKKIAIAKNTNLKPSKPGSRDIQKKPVKPPQLAKKPPPKVIIGMDGYSPVSLWHHRKWVEGKAEFAVTHKGVTYHLANAEEVQEFQLNPSLYAPRLLGCDPVVLNETDRAIPGNIDFGAYFDGELFFFVSAESRKKFRENPLRYTKTRHVLRVDHFGGTVRR